TSSRSSARRTPRASSSPPDTSGTASCFRRSPPTSFVISSCAAAPAWISNPSGSLAYRPDLIFGVGACPRCNRVYSADMRPRPRIGYQPHRGPSPHVVSIVLAGGEGRRLHPLTAERAKPAVPIGGRYRLVDFVLSNFVNSGFFKITGLTQYQSDSLNAHIARGWRLTAMLDFYVDLVPAQQRTGKDWYRGSADAMWQSLNVITDEDPDFVAVFGGDHIYKMDVRQMLDF